MKSNQECLPPKKREIPSSTLLSEKRSAAPAADSQRTENMPWLANVAGGSDSGAGERHSSSQSDGPHFKSLFPVLGAPSSSSSARSVQSLPAVYTSPLSQSTVGGAVHYSQLPPNLQFITSPYTAPYTGYVSQMFPPLPPPPPPPPLASPSLATQRSSHAAPPAASSQGSQPRASAVRTAMPPPPTDPAPHHAHRSPSARTLPSPPHQGGVHLPPHSLHPRHPLAHAASQAVVQYADGAPRKEEVHSLPRELHNGELERGHRFRASPDSNHPNPGSKSKDNASFSSYEARHLVLPPEYAPHDPSALRTPVMLMPNSHGDHRLAPPRASPEKVATTSSAHMEKGGILLGKPVTRAPSSTSTTSSFIFPPPLSLNNLNASASTLSPQTVIQTTHSTTESLSMGLPSTGIYPQPPIIGYIAGSDGSQPSPISYHSGLQQHLLIPGTQPLIIPVSGGGVATLDTASSHVTSSGQAAKFPTTLPCTYIAAMALKRETLEPSGGSYHQPASGALLQAQLHLPVVPGLPGLVAPSAPPPPSGAVLPPSLPPYFVKGSIIQLANGELKRVEDLKTEDFIQSAEISSDLKIDSSTVERIDGSHTSPDFAVVQFSVGEHRSQVRQIGPPSTFRKML